jgi:hypothetical protein
MLPVSNITPAVLASANELTHPLRNVDKVQAPEPSQHASDNTEQQFPKDRVTLSRGKRESGTPKDASDQELDAKDKAELVELQTEDRRVRAHERAHQAAGGSAAGPASFTYQMGPDNRQYAVAGEVPIMLKSGRTPDETIANARQVRAAALAPSDPSSQDLAVAAAAAQMEMMAQAQKALTAARAYQGKS